MIKAYLDGGDRDGFGSRNPFDNFSGEGGTEGLAKALAVSRAKMASYGPDLLA